MNNPADARGRMHRVNRLMPDAEARFDFAITHRRFGVWRQIAKRHPELADDEGELGDEDDPSVFNMAHMGLRMAQRRNGVAQLHGIVSRGMFADLWRTLRRDLFTTDRPELHYMRGPGPKWREKHAPVTSAAPIGHAVSHPRAHSDAHADTDGAQRGLCRAPPWTPLRHHVDRRGHPPDRRAAP